METVNYNNFRYTIKCCMPEDIDNHFTYVKSLLFYGYEYEYNTYKSNMLKAIHEGYAYQVYKDNKLVAFLYLTKHFNLAIGNSLFSTDMFALFLLAKKLLVSLKVSKISYYPHRKMILKKLISKESLTRYYFYNSPLIFPVKTLMNKVDKLSKRYKV